LRCDVRRSPATGPSRRGAGGGLTPSPGRIVARNARTSSVRGELDLIALDGPTLVFVEVKARGTLDAAAESVTPQQKRRICAAAEAWLAAHPDDPVHDMRFDAVLVAPGRLPRHIPAAFEVET